MHITTPDTIETIAWEGKLEPPPIRTPVIERPVVTLGQPEIYAPWDQEKLLGKAWVPPLGDARYWLVRLACSLHPPKHGTINKAWQNLILQPQRHNASATTYAHSLYPLRLTVEESRERNAKIGPELKIGEFIDGSLGEVGVTIGYKKVFPVIQSYEVGTPHPYWTFRAHAGHPLEGTQYVYAVVAAKPATATIQAAVEIIVELESDFGLFRFGIPKEVQQNLAFKIP